MSKQMIPSATSHESSGRVNLPGWPWPTMSSPDGLEQVMQLLLDRDKYSLDTALASITALVGDGSNVMLTPEGGLAVRCLNRTGAATEEGMIVAPFIVDIDIEAGAVAAADATMVRGALCAVQECDAAATNQVGVMYSDGIADLGDCWVVVAGRCQVQVGAGAEIPWGAHARVTSANV